MVEISHNENIIITTSVKYHPTPPLVIVAPSQQLIALETRNNFGLTSPDLDLSVIHSYFSLSKESQLGQQGAILFPEFYNFSTRKS